MRRNFLWSIGGAPALERLASSALWKRMAGAASVLIALLLSFSLLGTVQAAELHVLAGGAMAAPLRELAAQFEKASGHSVVFRFGTTPELIEMASSGGPFELGVVPREVFMNAAAKSKFEVGPTVDIASVGLGVAVRSGAAKPDISTPEALKQTLLNAQSIATIPASAAGAQVLRVFQTLGISDAVKAKIKAQPGPLQVVAAVAQGDAELGVFLINVLTAPGVDIVGPIPAELQQEVVFTAGVAAHTPEAGAARAFIAYLQTPAATAVLRERGMNPRSPRK